MYPTILRGLIALALALPLTAQVIVVDPNGGGAYRDIQDALDVAPAGAILRVLGGVHGPLEIRRSVTILGDPAPRIRSTPNSGPSGGDQPPAIRLAGAGNQTLNLVNVLVRDTPPWGWNLIGEGIKGNGFDRVYIERSTVEAMTWTNIATGVQRSTAAIDVPGAHVVVVESDVAANNLYVDYVDPYFNGYAGAPGIIAARITVLFSQVRGGNASPRLRFYTPPPTRCPCDTYTYGGVGGDATRGRVFATPGSLIGGRGSEILAMVNGNWASFGLQPNGVGMPRGGTTLHGNRIQGSALRLGQSWNLSFPGLAGSGVLALGIPTAQPISFGADWLMVQATGSVLWNMNPGQSTWQRQVPNLQALAGCEIAVQIWDTGTGRLTLPILRVATF